MSARETIAMRIRTAGLADIDRIMDIERSWFHLSHWSVDSYYRLMTEDIFTITYVAEVAGGNDPPGRPHVAGFVIFHVVAGLAEIYNIAVEERHARTGMGGRLIRAAIEECRRRNAEAVSLEVRKSNLSAIGFYRKFEFRVVGERRDYYSNPVEDALVMERTLGGAVAGA